MNRSRAVGLGLVALGLAVASFVVMGFGQLVVGHRLAVLFAAPLGFSAFALAMGLAVLFVLGRAGIGPLADAEADR